MKDVGSERSVLSGLLKYGNRAYIEVSDILDTSCFTTDLNVILYSCIKYLFEHNNEMIDTALLYSAAKSLGFEKQVIDSTETSKFIRALYSFPIDEQSLRSLAMKIVTLKIARETQNSHKEAYDKLSKLTGDEDITDILAISEAPYVNMLSRLTETDEIKPAGDNIDEYVQNLIEGGVKSPGIPTPFPIYNKVIGNGLRRGVHLIAARFKVGKSSFAKETAIHVSGKLQIPTLYIDTEMAKDEQDNRILAGLSLIPIDDIENGYFSQNQATLDRVLQATAKYKNLNFFHKNVAGLDFQTILNYMKRWIHKYVGFTDGHPNPHLIIYDYFKLMDQDSLKNMQEYQAMGFQIASLHDFCQKYNTPVLSFVQINRDGLTKDTTDVISQSDRLGWNCVSVCLYKRKTPEEIAEDGIENGNIKLIPLEGRFMKRLDDGDYINMYFRGEFSSIKELQTRNMIRKNAQTTTRSTQQV